MSGRTLKAKAKALFLQRGSKHEQIRSLIVKGFFDSPKKTQDLVAETRNTFGKRLRSNHVQTYMQMFMMEGIIHAVKIKGIQGNFWVLANVPKNKAIQMIGKDGEISSGEAILPESLTKKLNRAFRIEFQDLSLNYSRSGNCTAFLLRKILEKLIYIVFTHNGMGIKLEDKTKPGGLVGLEAMINIASLKKIRGVPLITSRTAREIKGIKFLGDASAHNPLVDVDMKTIIPQMPFIVTAYKELAHHL